MKKEEKNKFQKSKKTEIEDGEEIIISSEETADEILEIEPEEQEDEIENASEHIIEEIAQPETKPVPENSEVSNKLKIKAIKRAIENKKYSIDKEESKVTLWRKQSIEMKEQYNQQIATKKAEYESKLKKAEELYQKRMKRVEIWWDIYTDNFIINKVNKLKLDLELLQNELLKFEELETKESK